MENSIDHTETVRGSVWPLAMTLGNIVVTLILDSFYGTVTCAPLVGVCTLFLLALKCEPRTVFLCFIPLAAFVSLRLWATTILPSDQGVDITRFFIRVTTFLGAGALAISASAYRSRLDSIRWQLLKVLEAIPAPLIITDASGYIHAVSQEACLASGQTRENLVGYRIQDICGSHLLEEVEEDWYQQWLTHTEERFFEVELQLGERRSNAKFARVGGGRHTFTIIIFL